MNWLHWILLAWALGATLRVLWSSLPFHDPGSRVFTCSSHKGWMTMVKLLERRGLKPLFRIPSTGIERAMFGDGTILNCVSPELLERLDNPSDGIGFVVEYPSAAAEVDTAFLQAQGFNTKIFHDPEPGLAKGKMSFVKTDALQSAVLVYRLHKLKMGDGKMPPKWHYD